MTFPAYFDLDGLSFTATFALDAWQVIVDVPCPLSDAQAALYAAIAAKCGGSSTTEGGGGLCLAGVASGDASGDASGAGSLRALALACTHPCLALTPPADRSDGDGGDGCSGDGGGSSDGENSDENDGGGRSGLGGRCHSGARSGGGDSQYRRWLADDAVSGKFLALRGLISQLGYAERPADKAAEAAKAGAGAARGQSVAQGADGCSSSEGHDNDDDDDDDDDGDDGDDGHARKDNESEGVGSGGSGGVGGGGPKFLVFAQHRHCLDLVAVLVLGRFFPAVSCLRIDGAVPPQRRFEVRGSQMSRLNLLLCLFYLRKGWRACEFATVLVIDICSLLLAVA